MTKLDNIGLFFDWINERHMIHLKKDVLHELRPWSQDPLFQQYRFCNVFRELDRVTIWIRTSWREPYADHPNLPFAMCVARQFNTPGLLRDIGFPDFETLEEYDAWAEKTYAEVTRIKDLGANVYGGAYMIRGQTKEYIERTGHKDKAHYTIFDVLREAFIACEKLKKYCEYTAGRRLSFAHTILDDAMGWGPFMAYEVITDLRHTKWLSDSIDIHTWANAGPGAKRGLCRIHGRIVKDNMKQEQANEEMQSLLKHSTTFLPSTFPELEMRDIEHSLCEFDKYERGRLGEGRIKQKYRGV